MSKATAAETSLPWPTGWSGPKFKTWLVLGAVYLGMLSLGAVSFGVSAIFSEELGSAIGLMILGVYLGMITALFLRALHLRRRMSPKAVVLQLSGSTQDGVIIHYSAWLYRWLTTMLLLTFGVATVYLASSISGLTVPSFMPASDVFSVTVSILIVAYCLGFLIEIARGGVSRGWLILTPSGIHHRYYTFEHFLPWGAIYSVCAEEESGGRPLIVAKAFPSEQARIRLTSWVGLRRELKQLPFPSAVVYGRSLAVDPAVAYHALRYYHAHPEARAELLTSAGEQRIRSGNLLD